MSWLPNGRDYKLIEGLILVDGREVYNAGGKLMGVVNSDCPHNFAALMKALTPAKEQPQEEKSEGGLSFGNAFKRSPGRPKKVE